MLKPRPYQRRNPTQIIASGKNVQLIYEQQERFALVDLKHSLVYHLNRPSFPIGLFFLGDRSTAQLSVLQDPKGRISGFQLAELTCQFSTHPDRRPTVPDSTRLLVTPQGVHLRTAPDRDWITLFWQP